MTKKKFDNIAPLLLSLGLIIAGTFLTAMVYTRDLPFFPQKNNKIEWELSFEPSAKALSFLPGSRNGWFLEGLILSRFSNLKMNLPGKPEIILINAHIIGREPTRVEEKDNYERAVRKHSTSCAIDWGVNKDDKWSFVYSPLPGETGIFVIRQGVKKKLGLVRESGLPDRKELKVEIEISPSHVVARADGLEIARCPGYGVPQGKIAIGSRIRESIYRSFSISADLPDGTVYSRKDDFSIKGRLLSIWLKLSILGLLTVFLIYILSSDKKRAVNLFAFGFCSFASLILLPKYPIYQYRLFTAIIFAFIIIWIVYLSFRKRLREKPNSWKPVEPLISVSALVLFLFVGSLTPRPIHFLFIGGGATLTGLLMNDLTRKMTLLNRPKEAIMLWFIPSIIYLITVKYLFFPSEALIFFLISFSSFSFLARLIINDIHIRQYNWMCLGWLSIALISLELALEGAPLPSGLWFDRGGKLQGEAVFWSPSENGHFKFRNGYAEKEKKAQKKRIIAIGGSSTMGWPLEDPKAPYSAKLEELLKKDNTVEAQVLNAGVGGYTSFQGLQLLKRELLSYKPDMVTFCFGANDGNNNLEAGIGISDKEYFEARKWLANRWILNHLTQLSSRLVLPGTYRRLLFAWRPPPLKKRVSPDEFKENIDEFIQLGRAHQFIPLFLFEAEHRLGDLSSAIDTNPYYRILVEAKLNSQALLVDTVAALDDPQRDSYFIDNVHLSALGHEKVAMAIFRFLRDNHILRRWSL